MCLRSMTVTGKYYRNDYKMLLLKERSLSVYR